MTGLRGSGKLSRRAAALALVAVLSTGCVASAGLSPANSAATATAPSMTPTAAATSAAPRMTYPETAIPSYSYPPGADPALEALLPASVDGVKLFRWSIPGAHSGGGGDVCLFFCPGEPEYFALALKLTSLDGTTVAVAAPANQPTFPVMFYAFKVPGARTEDLAAAWVTAEYRAVADPVGGNLPTKDPAAKPTPSLEPLRTQQATIGGKKVTILYDRFASYFDGKALQYLYARGDVLFIVMAHEMSGQDPFQVAIDDPTSPPEAFVDSIAALPK